MRAPRVAGLVARQVVRQRVAIPSVPTFSGVEAGESSAFAGVLLLAEVLKEVCQELHSFRLANSYRQDLIGIPSDGKDCYPRESAGWCLCHSHFRQLAYEEKYPGIVAPERRHSAAHT